MTDDIRDRAVAIYDRFTHEHHDRRTLLREMTLLTGSALAAEVLIGGIAASPATAAIVAPDDKRLKTFPNARIPVAGGKPIKGYIAAPRGKRPTATVLVFHENRGLTPHIQDVARRVALAGFFAVASDFLFDEGGTPADEDRAREMIGAANLDTIVGEAAGAVRHFAGTGTPPTRVGVIGFCWGGALVNRVAIAAGDRLSAGIAYYGPAPDPAEAVKVSAPLLLHYAGKDARVAQTGEPWVAALKAAGKPVEAYTYPGVDHAFNNDTSAQRYDKAAADLAWSRTIAFLHRYLDA
ncbi:carboxymethylenebutenolidase [Sphingomonas palmae]|uniref:Carboxymethylenebutenolidase n=1 Tax=Sphingomonas palmae TaxID=1855283 RepID=A0A1H7LZG8_9SPHN|nr:dienelactone hydrolase family protein [Sphingomonas palmae]SEL03875.1 carboxymethylenebutenolidase [Sphingomonas palmae]